MYDGGNISEVVVPAKLPQRLADTAGALLSMQEHIGWWDWSVNGWTQATISADGIDIAFWLVDDVTDPASGRLLLSTSWADVVPSRPERDGAV